MEFCSDMKHVNNRGTKNTSSTYTDVFFLINDLVCVVLKMKVVCKKVHIQQCSAPWEKDEDQGKQKRIKLEQESSS